MEKKEEKSRCQKNKENRLSQKNMHTVGPKGFARVRDEMMNEHPNKEPPSLGEIFERTRKRTEGKLYADSYEDTSKKIEAMKKFTPPEDGNGHTDPFLAIMGKEYDGRRRLYGGVSLIRS